MSKRIFRLSRVLPGVLALCFSHSLLASIDVTFVESAPKDRFEVKNSGQCSLTNLTLEIDLSNSAGSLIFDTTASGAGVEVFQPFEVRSGAIALVSANAVKDGDRSLSVNIPSLAPGASVSFTIDVDDTLANSELGNIRVSGSEISGSAINLKIDDVAPLTSFFSSKSSASIVIQACP